LGPGHPVLPGRVDLEAARQELVRRSVEALRGRRSAMALDPRILELLSRWEEERAQGRTLAPEELCRDCPDLLAEVKRRLEDLQSLDHLVNTPAADDTPPGTPLPE